MEGFLEPQSKLETFIENSQQFRFKMYQVGIGTKEVHFDGRSYENHGISNEFPQNCEEM